MRLRKRKRRPGVIPNMGVEVTSDEEETSLDDVDEWVKKKESEEKDRRQKKQRPNAAHYPSANVAASVRENGGDAVRNGSEPTVGRQPSPGQQKETEELEAEISRLKAENDRLARELRETKVALNGLQAQHANGAATLPQTAASESRRPSSVAVTSNATSRAGSPSRMDDQPRIHRSSLTSNSVARPAQLHAPTVKPVRRLTPNGVMPPSFSPAARNGMENTFAKPDLALRIREAGRGKEEFTFLKRLT